MKKTTLCIALGDVTAFAFGAEGLSISDDGLHRGNDTLLRLSHLMTTTQVDRVVVCLAWPTQLETYTDTAWDLADWCRTANVPLEVAVGWLIPDRNEYLSVLPRSEREAAALTGLNQALVGQTRQLAA